VAGPLDRAPFMVLGNEVLLALAKAPVRDLAALAAVKGVGPSAITKYGEAILAAQQRGLDMPKDQWPRLERPKRLPRDPQLEERVKRLKAERDKLAAEQDLRPGIVAANHLLMDLGRAKPANLDELLAVPEMRRYQALAFGPRLLEVM
jgi:ribonuclease D